MAFYLYPDADLFEKNHQLPGLTVDTLGRVGLHCPASSDVKPACESGFWRGYRREIIAPWLASLGVWCGVEDSPFWAAFGTVVSGVRRWGRMCGPPQAVDGFGSCLRSL